MLEYLKKHFGGSIAYLDERAQTYNYTFSANQTRDILPRLIPYLLIKKEQAEIVVSFLERMEATNFGHTSDEDFTFYEQCFEKCRALKQIRYNYKPKRIPFGMKNCIRCGNEFLAYSFNHKYCSHKCKVYAHLVRTGIKEA